LQIQDNPSFVYPDRWIWKTLSPAGCPRQCTLKCFPKDRPTKLRRWWSAFGVPNHALELPELAQLEILPVALNLVAMAMDILPGDRCRNARFTGKHLLLSDWHTNPLELGIVPTNLLFT